LRSSPTATGSTSIWAASRRAGDRPSNECSGAASRIQPGRATSDRDDGPGPRDLPRKRLAARRSTPAPSGRGGSFRPRLPPSDAWSRTTA
jgi:hypothetical protein